MKTTTFDGIIMNGPCGPMQVFSPPWWRVDRWLAYAWAIARGKRRGVVEVSYLNEQRRFDYAKVRAVAA